MDVIRIELNLKNAYKQFHEDDHHKLFDGAYFTVEEANEFRFTCSSVPIAINDSIDADYHSILEDGTIEVGTW
ncbi:hypothetical protein [Paenibacillus agilis]|uniref:Uncharacterized protein n=1 Tax=Paenibacillus agilis TaxID=3020863 RepID=A0A559IEM4_9BACL|nr:hypothetical protein [Paenibacillus agilis]TVX86099.1 hypothetical protein FPZ44_24495 [Paenibacillus agilis]